MVLSRARVHRMRQPVLDGQAAVHAIGKMQTVACDFATHRPHRIGQRPGIAATPKNSIDQRRSRDGFPASRT